MFCALGTWQLYRLQWKTALISEITFGLDSTPVKYSNTIKKNYQRVVSEGKFNFEDQIYLYSLNESGKPGYDVITPYKTLKNENVLVNRGWINKNLKGNLEINLKENEVLIADKDGFHTAKARHFFIERYEESYRNIMIDFVNHLSQESSPSVSANDGLKALKIALAVKQSFTEKRAVQL